MINADKQPTGKIISSPPKVTREIVEAVNPVIADGFALYEKTKYFYLHPAESADRDYQLLLDGQAREIFASMDTLAEQLRQNGAPTVRSISHTGELRGVETYHGEVLSPGRTAEELIADNQRIAAALRAAGRICEQLRETTIGKVLQDILDQTERRIRLLGEAKTKN